MKKFKHTGLALIISSITFIGCGGGNFGAMGSNDVGINFNLTDYPLTETLSQELKDALAYMGNEERLAYDIYMNLYTYHIAEGITIKQLYNIPTKSEIKHVGIVQEIVQRYNLDETNLTNVTTGVADNTVAFDAMPNGTYDIPTIQSLYNLLYDMGINSAQTALEVGCMVEVTDINDLNNYLTLASTDNALDIQAGFEVLRDGSYNHYWAFDKGLQDLGISEGCCTLGTLNDINYCHPEYPQNTRGNH